MKTLTIRQPWAWCIVHGYKKIENRKRRTNYTGPFYIHAGKNFDYEGLAWIIQQFGNIFNPDHIPLSAEFYKGGIIGFANLVECVSVNNPEDMKALSPFLLPWFFGPYGYVIDNIQPIIPFQPVRGQRGWFDVDLQGVL